MLFIINDAAGTSEAAEKRAVIEAGLAEGGRTGEILVCRSGDMPQVAAQAAAKALARNTAVVAVGGDGSLNAVAQAAHAAGCVMGIVPYGTFNYFARVHGIPTDPAEAMRLLLASDPWPVQVSAMNQRLFLVNASLGVYPELLQDREAFKARFGRNRVVAWLAALSTVLHAQRRLRLRIETQARVSDVQTMTLFVGNNPLQLAQFGAKPDDAVPGTPGDGSMAALMLKPIGTVALLALMLQGAMGRLGEAAGVEGFEFQSLVVKPRLRRGSTTLKVGFDGEVATLQTPLHIRVLDKPLYVIKPASVSARFGTGDRAATRDTPP